ncbi:hypothetical protein [Thermoflexibacter ruber]|uniref:Uncharacterized protein n=1 Tax=Thermoflexibacter ruber TaxID=1003 RepID=A0A1I2HEU6_9BACT|nr:hypothetical protein [Thermoflexibacter ruber]SFF27051.1 hypothetical protein SAMN04488541_10234 [Thermoflexibacter ruber]
MKALEFSTVIDTTRQIEIPQNYWNLLSKQSKVRIIILIDEPEKEAEDWDKLTAQQFLEGYAAEDAMYDKL